MKKKTNKINDQIVTPDGYTTNTVLGTDVWNGQLTLSGEVVTEEGFIPAEAPLYTPASSDATALADVTPYTADLNKAQEGLEKAEEETTDRGDLTPLDTMKEQNVQNEKDSPDEGENPVGLVTPKELDTKKNSSQENDLDTRTEELPTQGATTQRDNKGGDNNSDSEEDQKSKKKTKWNVSHRFTCIWLKFYAEQCGLPVYEDQSIENQKHYLNKALSNLLMSQHDYMFHSIVHDNDDLQAIEKDSEAFWKPEVEKPHIHLLIFFPNGGRMRISTLLKELEKTAGIKFREDKDTGFFYKGTKFPDMRKKEHIKALVYHTHESDTAKHEEGKYQYYRSQCVTNIPSEILDSMYMTYFQQLSQQKTYSVVEYDLMIKARQLGRQALPFDKWWFNQVPFNYRLPKIQSRCIDEYNQGLIEFLESPNAKSNIRCSIFIEGAPNLGKTYTSKLTLEQMGISVYAVEAGKSNKFDDLNVRYGGMVISDTGCDDLLAVSDNNFCRVYRRQSGSPIWAGRFLVITYNKSFKEYCKKYAQGQDFSALCSRFFICKLTEEKGLKCSSPQTRGDEYSIRYHMDMFADFATRFNQNFFEFLKHRPDTVDPVALFRQRCGDFFDASAEPISFGQQEAYEEEMAMSVMCDPFMNDTDWIDAQINAIEHYAFQ